MGCELIILCIVTLQGSTAASQAATDIPPYSIQFKTAHVVPGAVRKDSAHAQKSVGSWKEEVARGNKSQKWILVRRAIDAVGDIWLPEGAQLTHNWPCPIWIKPPPNRLDDFVCPLWLTAFMIW